MRDPRTQSGKDGDATFVGRGARPNLVARLKRDHPDIAERLAAGEFHSARAAAIAAGIIVPPTPLDQVLRAFRRLSAEDQAAFAAAAGFRPVDAPRNASDGG